MDKEVQDTNYEDMKSWLQDLQRIMEEWQFGKFIPGDSKKRFTKEDNDSTVMLTQEELREEIILASFTTGLVLGKVKEREDWGMEGEPLRPLEDEEDL